LQAGQLRRICCPPQAPIFYTVTPSQIEDDPTAEGGEKAWQPPVLAMLSFDALNLRSRRLATDAAPIEWPSAAALVRGDCVSCYGQRFVWGAEHRTAAQLAPLRRRGDAPADGLLQALGARPGDDVLALAQRAAELGADGVGQREAVEFLAQASQLPPWLDEAMLARGQAVFLQYSPVALLSLFYISLVGGFSAPLITKVLMGTGYLTSAKKGKVMERLVDTHQMVARCLEEGALLPGAEGHEAVLRVRFLHSSVRRRMLCHGKRGAGGAGGAGAWDSATYGVPVNQEDLAATLLAFSYNVRNSPAA